MFPFKDTSEEVCQQEAPPVQSPLPATSNFWVGLVVPKTLLEGDNRRMEKGDCELYLFEGTKLIKAWLQLVI